MSEEYRNEVEFKGNPNGTVSFATEVLATIAGLAVNEIEGVASMSSTSSSIAEMFNRRSSRSFTKGVRVAVNNDKVTCDVSIVVDYGNPIPEVARGIQENVKKAIENMSGLEVIKVDVHVTGLSFEKENRATAELTEQQKKMIERTEPAPVQSDSGSPAPSQAQEAAQPFDQVPSEPEETAQEIFETSENSAAEDPAAEEADAEKIADDERVSDI